MGNLINHIPIEKEGVAVAYEHIYSERELAEIMNSQPMRMLSLNLGLQTNWYDLERIERIARGIKEEADVEMLMTLIVVSWEKQTDEHHEKVARFIPEFKTWVPYVTNLREKLDDVLKRIQKSHEIREKEEELRRSWAERYSTQTAAPHFTDAQTQTSAPSTDNFSAQYPYDAQSEDVKEKLKIEGELYSEMADIIAVEVKQWVDKRSIKDWNVLRYVLRKHDIFPDNVSQRIFADFLNTILGLEGDDALKADTISSRKDANVSVRQAQISWKLKNDAEDLEKKLKPVFDKMKSKIKSEK